MLQDLKYGLRRLRQSARDPSGLLYGVSARDPLYSLTAPPA